ncbi:MAG: hypothetical protein OEO19_08300 [Gammaproteobacteria bacterium]|nr:hypothetical protein [Gammaproteobacteria bacterium]MDH3447394.1 hypothetical protein [Gammaproteobacteria bacterium]
MIPDVKDRLSKVIGDPHFSNRERQLARASLQRINELESQIKSHWTQMARTALLTEQKNDLIDKQAGVEIDNFLKRQRAGDK